MRIRRRYVALLASGAALLAFAGVATGITDNVSSLSGSHLSPSTLPKTTFRAVTLFSHTHTTYAHPGNKAQGGYAKTVTLLIDNDIKINLTGIPKCTANLGGLSPKQAYAKCGPNGTNAKAYLSLPGKFSGTAHAYPNIRACTMVFNGPTVGGNPTTVLYTRAYTLNPVNCATNPANDGTTGPTRTTVILSGPITNAGVPDFGKKLTVPNIDKAPLPLDDFTAAVRRGSVFSARCNDANKILNLRGIFRYSGVGQPTDTVNHTQTCTVG